MTFYDILVKPGSISKVKQLIENNGFGTVTDSMETKGFSLIRADLRVREVGNVLLDDYVLSIEKPAKCSRS